MDKKQPIETFYESQLRTALADMLMAGGATIVEGSGDTFALLRRSFPVSGSKINWAQVPGARQSKEEGASSKECIDFWERVALEERLSGIVIYACDGEVSFSVQVLVPNVTELLRAILEIPQHHYLVGFGGAWCLCFAVEGDVDFGRSPTFRGLQ